MKKILFSLAISFIASTQLFGQEFTTTHVVPSNFFNSSLKSGFYETGASQHGYPSLTWPYPYRYLFNIRTSDVNNTYQFQISTAYIDDDRVFFRKVFPFGSSFSAKWQEFATRGENKFVGNQYVTGVLFANEIKVEPTSWADFVFSPDYNLRPLSEVKSHIQEFRHLPDIPSESEVKENGIELSKITQKLLQKIEELTLYVIEQDEKIEKLNNKISDLENSNR